MNWKIIALLVLIMVGLAALPASGERAKRGLTVPMQPGDEELINEAPFLVDKDREFYPKLTPQEMTSNELNAHLRLMVMKRERRDKQLIQKKLNEIGINPEVNPYREK